MQQTEHWSAFCQAPLYYSGAVLVAPWWAGVANPAAVADGVEEAAVAGVAGVAAGQGVTQA